MADIGTSIHQAARVIQQGGLVVYPTEGVFGIGCDHRNEASVNRLLSLKQRPVDNGLILAAGHVQQVLPLIQPNKPKDLARALKSWPGHMTWVFPATSAVAPWITGNHDSVAVRVSQHPVIQQLSQQLNMPIVSTSANIHGQPTPTSCADIVVVWAEQVDYYLDLPLGGATKPSEIRLAATGEALR